MVDLPEKEKYLLMMMKIKLQIVRSTIGVFAKPISLLIALAQIFTH